MHSPLTDVVNYLRNSRKKLFEGLIWFHSPGHMVLEGDYISRLISFNLKDSPRCLLLIEDKPPAVFLKESFEFNNISAEIVITPEAYRIQREIAVFFPQLTIEGAMWSFKVALHEPPSGEYNFNFLNFKSFDEYLNYHKNTLLLRNASAELNVFKHYFEQKILTDPKNQELVSILAGKRYAAIQLKRVVWNGVGALQTEQFYRTVLGYLRDIGITPVIIGREKAPEYFSEFHVIDYTQSRFVSYVSDWILIGLSTIGMVHASGLSNIFDILNKKYVFHDAWHHWPPHSNECLFVPSTIRRDGAYQPLSFREFCNMARSGYDHSRGGFIFPERLGYSAEPASSQIVISAISQLLGVAGDDAEAKAALKKRIVSLDCDDYWSHTGATMPLSIEKYLPYYFI